MKSAKKAASAKPAGTKRKKATRPKKAKSAGKIGFSPDALDGVQGDTAEIQIAELMEDIQRIFLEAVQINEKAPDAMVEIGTKDILRLAGVTLALAHQMHEYGQQDQSRILEGAWSIVASLVQKQGGEITVTADDLEAVSNFQLKRDVNEENSALLLSIVEIEETVEAETAEPESDEKIEENQDV